MALARKAERAKESAGLRDIEHLYPRRRLLQVTVEKQDESGCPLYQQTPPMDGQRLLHPYPSYGYQYDMWLTQQFQKEPTDTEPCFGNRHVQDDRNRGSERNYCTVNTDLYSNAAISMANDTTAVELERILESIARIYR